jgi:hypothetical protein
VVGVAFEPAPSTGRSPSSTVEASCTPQRCGPRPTMAAASPGTASISQTSAARRTRPPSCVAPSM